MKAALEADDDEKCQAPREKARKALHVGGD